ncbi:auxin response factor 19-like isoform X1 [Olea europaea subsp. europaea]|uniref:Auxin response factor n=1 Tax=Olea europaea subsp. europaea TaxID=158383 RepID=A0A8S0R593_OLEEU|nr:auxin response factor 19-like isoform X1 [Olea europaea subsp. europaea]
MNFATMKVASNGYMANPGEGGKILINSELWHACAGPLVSLPPVGSLVVYFPQGHSEQVAASMQKEADSIPSYPNLPSKLICRLHSVTLHADTETDEVYAQMTLQPVSNYDQEALLLSEMGLKQSRQPSEFFCKTLTASDTSTHGGFSVPRRAAEKIFPLLDFSMQPPSQELVAKDLHNQSWTFRHIYRGQPKRHLLTTGWSVFVSSKRLAAGDSVLFIRDEKSQLFLGIRHATRQQPAISSSVISSDSMHIGILAAAAHAAANNSPFTIFYNPRASPSEFVIPLAKYNKAMYTQVSLGMRFRMMFETEESGVRRYMGTITGIGDLDPVRWKNSQWRNLQVGWDESTAGERPSRVSIWEIEPVVTPFYICPPPFFRPKFSKQPGFPDDDADIENIFKRGMPWIADEFGLKDTSSSIFPGLSLVQWMNMQQNQQFSANQSGLFPNMVSSANLHGNLGTDDRSKLLNFQSPAFASQNLQFSKINQQNQQVGQIQQQPSSGWPQQQPLQQILPSSVNPVNNGVAPNQIPNQNSQQTAMYSQQLQQQQLLTGNTQMQQNVPLANKITLPMTSLPQDMQFQQQIEQPSSLLQRPQQQQTQMQQTQPQFLQPVSTQKPQVQQTSQPSLSEHQLQMQILQKLQQQQQQMSSPLSSFWEPSFPQQQQALQQNQLPQQLSSTGFTASTLLQSPQFPVNQLYGQQKSTSTVKSHPEPADGAIASCSTSPCTNNMQVSPLNFLNRNQPGSSTLLDNSVVHPVPNLVPETRSKSDVQVKNELPSYRGSEQPKYSSTANDHLDAASSETSYCLDASGQQNFSLTGLDGDIQSHPRSSLTFTANIDGLTPDALLSRGCDSGKDIQNLLSNYNGNPRDIETEFSSAGINSQTFGVPNMSFNAGCSNDVAINEAGVLNSGLRTNQTQCSRTYTKVQKRGSVGRTIDVTRYKGYDELRHDLARMFGIKGLLEDPQRSEWKLVYVDHENDILLVGDDPWDL